jgi:alkylation response protein AidB-like acyl-CoA dehydrogenase
MSVRYAHQREQFGKPIGSFQAVKHQLADVFVANAFALPVVHRAAWSVAHDLPSRVRDASHAKHAAGRAAAQAARTALQVHAGIGYTYEHDLHMWMKRTWSLSSLWGDTDAHRRRVAAAVLADEPPPRVP